MAAALPLLAGPSSPAKLDRALRGVVLRTETTGRERRARGIRPGLRRGRRTPERPAPWPAATNYSGERGRGARGPRFAQQKNGEGAGKKTKLTTVRIRSENGSKRRDDTRRRLLLRRQFSA